ncbi:hypothetical protein C8J57DRAFT_1311482 [Mycena rebaudengoi]|nr:hypothetical protein C8J57DRAFT_1311482 [Mycena rebaudengoi]
MQEQRQCFPLYLSNPLVSRCRLREPCRQGCGPSYVPSCLAFLSSDSAIEEHADSSPAIQRFKWVRGDLIGQGTRERTYLAMNPANGDIMAVKQIAKPSGASPSLSTVLDLRSKVGRISVRRWLSRYLRQIHTDSVWDI